MAGHTRAMTSCCCTVRTHKNGAYKIDPADLSCNDAVHYGHLECLRYLRESGFPWNSVTYAVAICKGDMKCLRYMHETKEFLQTPIQCFDFDYNIRTNSIYMNNRKPCYRFLIERGYSFEDHEEEFDKMFEGEDWYVRAKSMKKYLATGDTDEYSAHLDVKVRKIQCEWLKYAYHPKTRLGHNRMMRRVSSMEEILLDI